MPVKEVSNGGLKQELERAGDKVVLVDFFATWCGPCNAIAPAIDKLSQTHPNAVFLKVDVDQCENEARDYEIKAMPTFVFIRRSKELERVRGADPQAIETTLTKYYKETTAFAGQGHSMLDNNSASAASSKTNESEIHRFEQIARERFGQAGEGQTMTNLRLRLPDFAAPVNIRLGTDRTLDDVRRLLCESIESFQTIAFEFMQPPAMKINDEEEKKTLSEAKLTNAVLTVKKIL